MIHLLALVAAVVVAPALAQAQPAAAVPASRTRAHVDMLASPKLEGRLTGSPGADAAAASQPAWPPPTTMTSYPVLIDSNVSISGLLAQAGQSVHCRPVPVAAPGVSRETSERERAPASPSAGEMDGGDGVE